jgi:hypothetical protein
VNFRISLGAGYMTGTLTLRFISTAKTAFSTVSHM